MCFALILIYPTLQLRIKRFSDSIDITKPCDKAFRQFKIHYHKKYNTFDDEQQAQEQFCKSLAKLVEMRQNPDLADKVSPNALMDIPMSKLLRGNEFAHQNTPKRVYAEGEANTITGWQQTDNFYTNYGYFTNNGSITDANLKDYNRQNNIKPILVCNQTFANGDVYMKKEIQEYIIKEIAKGDPPLSVDLREWGIAGKSWDQGSCGSCYAFTARYVVLGNYHHDLPYYRNIYKAMKNYKTGSFKPSVEMLLADSYGSNMYCGGGIFQNVAADIVNSYIPSLEYDSNYPYVSMNSEDIAMLMAPKHLPAVDPEFIETPLLPVHRFNGQDCPKSVFFLESNGTKNFSTNITVINWIKWFLAHGIIMSGRMYVGEATDEAYAAFYSYNGQSVAYANCTQDSSNHQVTLVGYGHFNKTPVWLFQNSWGSTWGQMGYFMVEIGKNAFCTEMDVTGVFPQFFRYNTTYDDYTKAFNETEMYQTNKDTVYVNVFGSTLKRGRNSLDDYLNGEPQGITWQVHDAKWAIVGVAGLLTIIWFVYFLKCQCCPSPRRFPKPIHMEITDQEIKKQDWSNAYVAAIQKSHSQYAV